MHHEILLAALGCPGDIIIPTNKNRKDAPPPHGCLVFEVAEDITFLSTGK